jgi:hypothetical protein
VGARGDGFRAGQYARDLGVVAFARGDLAMARARLEECQVLAERHQFDLFVVPGVRRLAAHGRLEGDYPRARVRLGALGRTRSRRRAPPEGAKEC